MSLLALLSTHNVCTHIHPNHSASASISLFTLPILFFPRSCRPLADPEGGDRLPRLNAALEIDSTEDRGAEAPARACLRLLQQPSLKNGSVPGGVLLGLLEVYMRWRVLLGASRVPALDTPVQPFLMEARESRRLGPEDVTPPTQAPPSLQAAVGGGGGGGGASSVDGEGPTRAARDALELRQLDAIIPRVMRALLVLCEDIGAAALKSTTQALRCLLVRVVVVVVMLVGVLQLMTLQLCAVLLSFVWLCCDGICCSASCRPQLRTTSGVLLVDWRLMWRRYVTAYAGVPTRCWLALWYTLVLPRLPTERRAPVTPCIHESTHSLPPSAVSSHRYQRYWSCA